VEYGENWPNYRVPTGVTTTDKDRLIQWVIDNVQSESSTEKIIETFYVDLIQPNSLLNQSSIIDEVHLLQVDTEGMDDEVVYSFLHNGVFPNIINVESKHLSKKDEIKYERILIKKGYDIFNYTWKEKLAIRR